MKTIRLLDIDGTLYFPTGGNPSDFSLADAAGNIPSLLLRVYDAGDCDTCPWPMVSDFKSEAELRQRMAAALYDERECNETFPWKDHLVIELPDGTPFDFDSELADDDGPDQHGEW